MTEALRVLEDWPLRRAASADEFRGRYNAIMTYYYSALDASETGAARKLSQSKIASTTVLVLRRAVMLCAAAYVDALLDAQEPPRKTLVSDLETQRLLALKPAGAGADCAVVRQRLRAFLYSFKAPVVYGAMPSRPSSLSLFSAAPVSVSDGLMVLPSVSDVTRRLLTLARVVSVVDELESEAAGVALAYSRTATNDLGVFAHARDFALGELVTAYEGRTVPAIEAQRLIAEGRSAEVRMLRANVWARHGERVALALVGRGGASLARDNVDYCASLRAGDLVRRAPAHNVRFALLTDADNAYTSATHFDPLRMHLVLVATRAIRTGDELVVDYGTAFWRQRLSTRADECARPLLLGSAT